MHVSFKADLFTGSDSHKHAEIRIIGTKFTVNVTLPGSSGRSAFLRSGIADSLHGCQQPDLAVCAHCNLSLHRRT